MSYITVVSFLLTYRLHETLIQDHGQEDHEHDNYEEEVAQYRFHRIHRLRPLHYGELSLRALVDFRILI